MDRDKVLKAGKLMDDDYVSDTVLGNLMVPEIPEPEVQDELDRIMAEDDLQIEPLFSRREEGSNRYTLEEKVLGIMFMEVIQHDVSGIPTPKFRAIGRMLNVLEQTLRLWWSKREDIMAQESTVRTKVNNYLIFKNNIELLRIHKAFSSRNYTTEKLKDLVLMFSTLINKNRLLEGKSTENVAHLHRHQVDMSNTIPTQLGEKKNEG